MSDTPTVFVVDDEPELLRAMTRLLRAEGLQVECFESGEAFLDALPSSALGCVLLDLAMPGLDGLEVQRRLIERCPSMPVIFLTAHGGVPESVRAVKAGAVDFLSKPVRRHDLLPAIEAAVAQAREWRAADASLEVLRVRLAALTPREREVFEHVVAGRLNKLIADRLGVSEQTVKVHRARVMDKMVADSVADLVRMADALGVAPRR